MFKISNEIIFIMFLTMAFLLIHSFMYRAIDFRLNTNTKNFVSMLMTTIILLLHSSKTYKFYVNKIIN